MIVGGILARGVDHGDGVSIYNVQRPAVHSRKET